MGFFSDLADSITGRSATRAADRVVEGNREAIEELRRQYDLTRADTLRLQQPAINARDQSLASLLSLLGVSQGTPGATTTVNGNIVGSQTPIDQLRNTPGYQFARNQGLGAVEGSAAARGGLFSGGTLKDLQQFGTGLADQTYNTRIAQLLQSSGLGQGGANAATGTLANAGNATAGGIGSLLSNSGQARASGIIGRSNSLNNLFEQAVGGARMAFGGVPGGG